MVTAFCACSAPAQDAPDLWECSRWSVTELTDPPDWCTLVAEVERPESRSQIAPFSWRIDYALSDSVTLVRYDRYIADPQFGSEDEPERYWFPNSSLYLYGVDTLLLDSSDHGFQHLSFNRDSTTLVAYKVRFLDDDGSSGGDIIAYDLVTGEIVTVRLRTETSVLALDTVNGRLAYTDWGDVYICDARFYSSELVFKGGGSYAQNSPCPGRRISRMKWSPDGASLVFQYGPFRPGSHRSVYEVKIIRDN